ncbi:MAG: primosomal protein N' [Rhodothermales bacterium]
MVRGGLTSPFVSMTVDVILPLPVDQAYSYAVPGDLAGEVQRGSRVVVPFGPRMLTGVVVQVGETSRDGLKEVVDVLDERPAFTDEMLRLARWMADYYVCPWGEAVKAALPAGTAVESQQELHRRDDGDVDAWREHPTGMAILRFLDEHPETTVAALRKAVPKASTPLLNRLEADGLLKRWSSLKAPQASIKHEKHVRLVPALHEPSVLVDAIEQLRGAKQIAVLEALSSASEPPRQADLLRETGAASSTVLSLAKRGLVEVFEEEVFRSPLGSVSAKLYSGAPAFEPHQHQRAAIEALQSALDTQTFGAFLLHGVTGSGKTEVYIAALKRTLALGQSGIILVPEIALTPQTVRRFQQHFGDQIAVLHSRMSLGERYDAWRALRDGRFKIVIGPRSAILAPLQNIGLIVVDEEHESSYKQFDPAPRYHARDVAVMRAHMNDAVCVLGSATPSIETFMNAQGSKSKRGKYTYLRMPERVPVPGRKAARLPVVTLVDLTLEKKKHQLDAESAISKPLEAAIRTRLERDEQVILLQNRRGYAPILECHSCGFTPTCIDCSVSLTYHKPTRHLRCHYCGRTQRVPAACPKCHHRDFSFLGTGTQRVEEELAERFPEAAIIRMDLDTTGRKNAHHKLLERFRRGEAQILLGTQMVAKGLDFPRVTLVGVINADTGLLLPDFRSDERTFQLLTQVAGRAGRAELQGEVILQTRNPQNPVIQYAMQHDYLGFVEQVLPERQMFRYPPFGRFVGIEFRGPSEMGAEHLGKTWTAELKRHAPDAVEVLGPEPAFIGRVKRNYRYHTLLKIPRSVAMREVQEALRTTQAQAKKPPKDYRVAINVDAVGVF